MPTISRQYHAHPDNYGSGVNWKRKIAIHNTENTAPAINEAKYCANNAHGSSYHYVLDGGGTIYQLLDDDERSWSVGGWSGAYQHYSNAETISIEVCSPGTEFTASQKDELAWLVQKLMERYGLGADDVVRHYDCHSGHKLCPRYYSNNETAWRDLHAYITGGDDVQLGDKLNDEMLVHPIGGNKVYNNVANCLDITRQRVEAVQEAVGKIAVGGASVDYDLLADKVVEKLAEKLAQ